MTQDEARDVMLGIFKAAWDLLGTPAGSYPVTYNDVAGVIPTSETTWARVTIRHATGRQSSLTGGLGTKRYTNRGFVWVQVFAPIGVGSTGSYVASQAVVNAFRDADTAVLFRNVVGREMGCDGGFDRIDVKADFEYDDVR